jgi:lipopolysaccharide transport system permease protein
VVQPLLTTVIFTVIFGNVAKISTQDVPHMLFYFSGNLIWHYFSNTLTKIAGTFERNANMFGKVYFPRLTVPVAVLITEVLSFAIQFIVFVVLYAYFFLKGMVRPPSLSMLVLPLLLLQTALFSLGIGILISSMTTKYRDLNYLLSFGTRLWMYATPIVYPMSVVPDRWRWVLLLNPLSAVVESFRRVCFGVGGMSPSEIGLSVLLTVATLFLGLLFFGRIERTFMDTV